MRIENISVCMATYNGSQYIAEQLESILSQLICGDELIIVDDSSSDNTKEQVLKINNHLINLYVNDKNMGVNKSFEKAISLAKNEYIFLADQDDIWTENRIEIMMKKLKNENVNLVSGNSIFIDEIGNKIVYSVESLKEKDSENIMKNLIKIFKGSASYYGCAMGFKKELINDILPFPQYIESHDLWIAKASILNNKINHIEENVLYRRVHGKNASIIKRPLLSKLWSRVVFIRSILELELRFIKNRK